MTALARQSLPRRRQPRLDELLEQARVQLVSSPRQALEAARQAVHLTDGIDSPSLRATALQRRGDAFRFLGQHEPALADYSSAAELFRRLRNTAEAARTDAVAVDSLRCLGRPTEALHLAGRARRVFKRLGEELRSAVLDEIVGLVFLQQNDYERALRLFDRARPIIAAAGRPLDLATLNNNAAITLTNLDRLREAATLYEAARSAYAQEGTDAALARIDMNLGYLAFRQGRYGAAMDLLRRAGDVFAELRNMPLAINTRLDLADTYLALNLLDEAGAVGQEQLDLAEQFGLDDEHARALFYLSTQRGRLGRFDEALDGLIRAEAEFADQHKLAWRARCVLARAALLLARGDDRDLSEAMALARRSARVFERHGPPSRQAVALATLARGLLRAGRVHAAEERARAALWLAQGLGVPWLLFECHYMLGRALRAAGRSDDAYLAYRQAADSLEHVREELYPEELRVSLVSDKTDVYQELVWSCLERSRADEALHYAERAKSRAFAERLVGSFGSASDEVDVDVVGTTDAQIIQRMRELRDELVWLYSRLSEGPAAATLQRLRTRVVSSETELMRLNRRLQPASRAHALAVGVPDPPSETQSHLDQLRRRLRRGTVILEYFQAGTELVLFLFDRRRLETYRLGPIAAVLDLVDRFRFQVAKFGLGDAYTQQHADALVATANAVLERLYSVLIGPCADDLVDVRQLVIVPHGVLHYLPFHALIDPTGTPLVDRADIGYAPSSAVLASCYERPAAAKQLLSRLLVGVPDAAIPHVEQEIDSLRTLFNESTVLVGDAATQQAFRLQAPAADVIHLASHAVFRQDNPLFSAIKLADGWLSLYDLYRLRLRASLVTLSACETGVNEVLGGDELVGLARGFLQAGARSLVVSLWAVNDQSTARLMQHFYNRLEGGLGPAAAMRRAQIDLRQHYPHPYFWAPFMVIGRA